MTTNTYDNNGNLAVTNDNGTVTTNTWTYENRLRTVTLATPATTTFTYDGDGLRRQTVTSAATTNFIWDGQDVLLETDVNNTTQATYTQTPNIYGDLVSQRRGDTTKYYHFDALGSTLALTDSNENVTDTYRYYAFGKLLTSTGSTTNPSRYVGNLGYYNESALALQYLRARYYQPSTGRFVSVDPIREGLNWYRYVDNNPISGIDPSGMVGIPVISSPSPGALPPACIPAVSYQFYKYQRGSAKDAWDRHKHCVLGCTVDRACGHEWVTSAAKLKEFIDKHVPWWTYDEDDIPLTLAGGDCPRFKTWYEDVEVPCGVEIVCRHGRIVTRIKWCTLFCRRRARIYACDECCSDRGLTYHEKDATWEPPGPVTCPQE